MELPASTSQRGKNPIIQPNWVVDSVANALMLDPFPVFLAGFYYLRQI
jgi:hypothetical protein